MIKFRMVPVVQNPLCGTDLRPIGSAGPGERHCFPARLEMPMTPFRNLPFGSGVTGGGLPLAQAAGPTISMCVAHLRLSFTSLLNLPRAGKLTAFFG